MNATTIESEVEVGSIPVINEALRSSLAKIDSVLGPDSDFMSADEGPEPDIEQGLTAIEDNSFEDALEGAPMQADLDLTVEPDVQLSEVGSEEGLAELEALLSDEQFPDLTAEEIEAHNNGEHNHVDGDGPAQDAEAEPEQQAQVVDPDLASVEAFVASNRRLADLKQAVQAQEEALSAEDIMGGTYQDADLRNQASQEQRMSLGAGLITLGAMGLSSLGRAIGAGGDLITESIHERQFGKAKRGYEAAFDRVESLKDELLAAGLATINELDSKADSVAVMNQFMMTPENRALFNSFARAADDLEVKAKKVTSVGLKTGLDEDDVYNLTGNRINDFTAKNRKLLEAMTINDKSMAERFSDMASGLLEVMRNSLVWLAQFMRGAGKSETAQVTSPGPRVG